MRSDNYPKDVYEHINRINLTELDRLAAISQMRKAEAITNALLGITAGVGRWLRASKSKSN